MKVQINKYAHGAQIATISTTVKSVSELSKLLTGQGLFKTLKSLEKDFAKSSVVYNIDSTPTVESLH